MYRIYKLGRTTNPVYECVTLDEAIHRIRILASKMCEDLVAYSPEKEPRIYCDPTGKAFWCEECVECPPFDCCDICHGFEFVFEEPCPK